MAQNLDLRCVLVPAPWVLGQNTSRIQNKEIYATLYLQVRLQGFCDDLFASDDLSRRIQLLTDFEQIKFLGVELYGHYTHTLEHGKSIPHSNTAPFPFKMACKQNLDLRCVLISDPSTLGASTLGASTLGASTLGAGAKKYLHTPKPVTYHEQSGIIHHDRPQPWMYGIQNKE